MASGAGLINENSIGGSRTVGHVDVDAFEWQVVCRQHPEFRGKPGIVVNRPNKIVAVSHEARPYGISRKKTRSVDEALSKCPDLIVHYKDYEFGKPEQSALRERSREIKDAIVNFFNKNQLDVTLDYASNDEFFFDFTKEVNKSIARDTNIVKEIQAQPAPQKFWLESTRQKHGRDAIMYRLNKVHPTADPSERKRYEDEVRLLHGAVLVSKIVAAVLEETGFTCSGGISHNMLLAKLGCGLNKPNGITMLPLAGLTRVSRKVLVDSIPGLGGDGPNSFGAKLHGMGIHTMFHLQYASMRDLNKMFKAENCHRLISWGHGISHDSVQERRMKMSMSSGKECANIKIFDDLLFWFGAERLGGELWEKLEEERVHNRRCPTKISIIMGNGNVGSMPWVGNETQETMLEAIRDELQNAKIRLPFRGALKLFVPEFVPLHKSK